MGCDFLHEKTVAGFLIGCNLADHFLQGVVLFRFMVAAFFMFTSVQKSYLLDSTAALPRESAIHVIFLLYLACRA